MNKNPNVGHNHDLDVYNYEFTSSLPSEFQTKTASYRQLIRYWGMKNLW